MSGFLICSAKESPQRRGRAHEEALCQQILQRTPEALSWLVRAGADGICERALASPLGGTAKADIFFRSFGESRSFQGLISAKLRTPSRFDPTDGFANHLHRCGAGASESFGLIPPEEANLPIARQAMLEWQKGLIKLSEFSEADRKAMLTWLEPGWHELRHRFVFGAPFTGRGKTDLLICTMAKIHGGKLLAENVAAFDKLSFGDACKTGAVSLRYSSACGGCFSDGLVALQAHGAGEVGLQAKLNVCALLNNAEL